MRILFVLVLLLAAAGTALWQAEARATQSQSVLLRTLSAQLQPLGSLTYDPIEGHFWGAGRIRNLRFSPSTALCARYDLPADFAVLIPTLHYRHWQPGSLWPASVQLRFSAATLPLAAPWPPQYSGTLDWQYNTANQHLKLGWTLENPTAAALQGELTLQLSAPESLAAATLMGGTLHYRDQGLAQGQRAALGMRLGADPQNAENALVDALAHWLTQQGLPPDAALRSGLQTFAHEPLAFSLRLDPPGLLQPQTLPQFAPADRITALGLSMENQ